MWLDLHHLVDNGQGQVLIDGLATQSILMQGAIKMNPCKMINIKTTVVVASCGRLVGRN